MKKIIFKICFFFAALFLCAPCFSDDWYVCLFACENLREAEAKKNFFVANKIPAFVKEFKKVDGASLYRIFFSETLESKEVALLLRKTLVTSPNTKNIVGKNIWVASVSEQKIPKANLEQRTINIKDSDTGAPIDNANVDIDQKWALVTNAQGDAPLPTDIPDGSHDIRISKGDDYVPTTSTFVLSEGKIASHPQHSMPKKVDYDRLKIILTWSENPSDLDSHIFCNDRHVYFSKKNQGNLNLDYDDTTSFGPETITIREPSENETYHYYIHNYSDKGNPQSARLSNSGAQVAIYHNNTFVKTFAAKPNQTGIWWHVFDLVGKNKIIVFDEISQTCSEE